MISKTGSWALGGSGWVFGWRPQDDAVSLATMRHVLKFRVNWIDTAAVYGRSRSEEMVGRLLRGTVVISSLVFTKCGLVWDPNAPMAPPRRAQEGFDSAPLRCGASTLIGSISTSFIGLMDETGTPVEDSWNEMVRLIKEGKVRLGGISNFDVTLLERCEDIRHVESLQPPFPLIRSQAAAREIAWCAGHGTGVICPCNPDC